MPAENIEKKLHLHARRLVIPHPKGGKTIDVTAPLPAHMLASWDLLGFDADMFED
jgi:23S rRNA pseudouridine955/2504/2580 synthase